MKKILPVILSIICSISSIAQIQKVKGPINLSDKKFVDQIMDLKSYDGFKTDSFVIQIFDPIDSLFNNSSLGIYHYSNGNNDLYTFYDWHLVEWVPGIKYEYSYDANGGRISDKLFFWDIAASQWNQTAKSVISLNQNGKDTLTVSYNWNETQGDWVLATQNKFDYDNDGNQTFFLMCQWNVQDTKWDSVIKSEVCLDENGKDTSNIVSYWNAGTSQWLLTNKSITFYDENGIDTLGYQYNWSGQWNLYQKSLTESNKNGEDSIVTISGWDYAANQWIGSFKFETFYEANRTTLNEYAPFEGEWQLIGRRITYYSEYAVTGIKDPSAKQIGVYPNPAKDYILIDMADVPKSATIQLFNVQGQKVLDQRIPDGKQISISNLPRGLYLYRINNKGVSSNGKMVKE